MDKNNIKKVKVRDSTIHVNALGYRQNPIFPGVELTDEDPRFLPLITTADEEDFAMEPGELGHIYILAMAAEGGEKEGGITPGDGGDEPPWMGGD